MFSAFILVKSTTAITKATVSIPNTAFFHIGTCLSIYVCPPHYKYIFIHIQQLSQIILLPNSLIHNFIFHYAVCRLSKGYCPCILFDSYDAIHAVTSEKS